MYLEDVNVLDFFAVLGLHELDPGITVGVVAVGAHDAEVPFRVGICQNIIMVLHPANDGIREN